MSFFVPRVCHYFVYDDFSFASMREVARSDGMALREATTKQSHVNMEIFPVFLFPLFLFLEFFPLFCCFHWLDIVYYIDYQLFVIVFPPEIFFPLFFLMGTFGFRFGLFGCLFRVFGFLFLPLLKILPQTCLSADRDAEAQRFVNVPASFRSGRRCPDIL